MKYEDLNKMTKEEVEAMVLRVFREMPSKRDYYMYLSPAAQKEIDEAMKRLLKRD